MYDSKKKKKKPKNETPKQQRQKTHMETQIINGILLKVEVARSCPQKIRERNEVKVSYKLSQGELKMNC